MITRNVAAKVIVPPRGHPRIAATAAADQALRDAHPLTVGGGTLLKTRKRATNGARHDRSL